MPWASVPRPPSKRQFLFADREVAVVDDLGRDVDAIRELEGDQVRFAILDFVQGGLFPRGALDVGKRVIVVDGRNQEWLTRRLWTKGIVELEFRCVGGAELVDLIGDWACAACICSTLCERRVSSSFLYAWASPAVT